MMPHTPPSPHRHACPSDTRELHLLRQLQPVCWLSESHALSVLRHYVMYLPCKRPHSWSSASRVLYGSNFRTCALRHHLQPTRDVMCSPPDTSGGRPLAAIPALSTPHMNLIACHVWMEINSFRYVLWQRGASVLVSTSMTEAADDNGQPNRYMWLKEKPPCRTPSPKPSASKMTS